ncbi:MAG: hypothetical protein EPO65_06965 [Dehalococcoidia bacterium]|nr:MAG: hypothetical protein EPO65_06965 [Dehalococcoidia bacterium]
MKLDDVLEGIAGSTKVLDAAKARWAWLEAHPDPQKDGWGPLPELTFRETVEFNRTGEAMFRALKLLGCLDYAAEITPNLARRIRDPHGLETKEEGEERLVSELQTATHEAGHGVAFHYLGVPFYSITLRRSGGGKVLLLNDAGHVEGAKERGREAVINELTACFAGGAASRRILHTATGCGPDLKQARELAAVLCRGREARQRLLRSCSRKAATLVADHETEVRKVGDELFRKGHLMAERVAAICARHQKAAAAAARAGARQGKRTPP